MTACPDDTVLLRAAQGALSDVDFAALETHLDGCSACRRVLAAVAGDEAAQPPQPLLGRYELGPLVGAGGMGVVYAARDLKLGRVVALKVLRPQLSDGPARARLVREAQVMARLSHPHVVNVFDVGEVEGRGFVAMEYVEGGTLRGWLETPRAVPALSTLFLQAGDGLAAAHRAGIVHRDFKPENVLLGADGRARVTDFGLANSSSVEGLPAAASLTETAGLLGTPAYMAPEQLRGEPADARSDQYAFCVAFYEALAGHRPHEAKTLAELRTQVLAGVVARPKREGFNEHVWHALERGLSLEPAERFASMEALLAALRDGPSRRGRGAVLTAAVLLPVVLGLAWVVALATEEPPAEPVVAAPPPRAVAPARVRDSERDVFVEPAAPERLPPEGTELALAPGDTRDFEVRELLRARIAEPSILDVEGTATELTLIGRAPGRTLLVLEFLGRQRSWPVLVRTAEALAPERRTLTVGAQWDFALEGITRVTVGNAALVDVVRQPAGLRFNALKLGTTNALVWTRDARRHELLFDVVAPASVDSVDLELGLQQVLTFQRLEHATVEPAALCELLPLNGFELLLTPRRSGEGVLEVWLDDGTRQIRRLRVHERR